MPAPHEPPVPSLADLFLGFGAAGLMGFGGVLPWARRMIVEQRGWLSPVEFNDLIALCQFLPGPNVVNLSVALGARYHGVAGSAACLCGLLLAPVVIAVSLGGLYLTYRGLPAVEGALTGLSAAGAGLLLATALKIAWPLRAQRLSMAVAALAFALIALARFPLLPTMLALVPLSILLHRYSSR